MAYLVTKPVVAGEIFLDRIVAIGRIDMHFIAKFAGVIAIIASHTQDLRGLHWRQQVHMGEWHRIDQRERRIARSHRCAGSSAPTGAGLGSSQFDA